MTEQKKNPGKGSGGGFASIIIKVFSLIVTALLRLGRLGGGKKDSTTNTTNTTNTTTKK